MHIMRTPDLHDLSIHKYNLLKARTIAFLPSDPLGTVHGIQPVINIGLSFLVFEMS